MAQSFVYNGPIDLGDGSDGALDFIYAGSTAVAGATLSGGVYTLTRDIFATSITVEQNVVIKPAGFRIRCQGTLYFNTANLSAQSVPTPGVISDNGGNASGITPGAALTTSGTLQRKSFIGGAQGTQGSQGTAATFLSLGGVGGAGGAQNGSQYGGAQSAVPVGPTGAQGSVHDENFVNNGFITANPLIGAQPTCGGAGGGGGEFGGSTSVAGSGGAGGGVIYIAAGYIGGTGTIEALGGNGGNSSGTGSTAGPGGGGGGGVLILATKSPVVTNGANGVGLTLSVAGGAAGTVITGGDGLAAAAGQAGNIYQFSPQA